MHMSNILSWSKRKKVGFHRCVFNEKTLYLQRIKLKMSERSTYKQEVESFERILRGLRERMLQTANGYLHNAEEVEDVVQEALMRSWIARKRLGSIDELPAFAMRTVKNLCIDRLRRQSNRSQTSTDLLVVSDEAPTADTKMILQEQQAWMMKCMMQLPPNLRGVLQMKGIDGLSYQEIAAILGTTEAVVRSKMSKARQKLWTLYRSRK